MRCRSRPYSSILPPLLDMEMQPAAPPRCTPPNLLKDKAGGANDLAVDGICFRLPKRASQEAYQKGRVDLGTGAFITRPPIGIEIRSRRVDIKCFSAPGTA